MASQNCPIRVVVAIKGLLDLEGKNLKIAQRNQKESPLLRLPPELRNRIFEYVFTGGDHPLDPGYERFNGFMKSSNFNLIKVCRQTFADTQLLPFSMTTFKVNIRWPPLEQFDCFVKGLAPEQRGAIRNLTIGVEYQDCSPYHPSDERFMCGMGQASQRLVLFWLRLLVSELQGLTFIQIQGQPQRDAWDEPVSDQTQQLWDKEWGDFIVGKIRSEIGGAVPLTYVRAMPTYWP